MQRRGAGARRSAQLCLAVRSAPCLESRAQLNALAERLVEEGVAHKIWIEQPEGIPTAIALKPYPKSMVGPLLKKYSLFK